MSSIYYHIGIRLGRLFNRGKWIYQSLFGTEEDALKAEYAAGGNLAMKIRNAYAGADDPAALAVIGKTGRRLVSRLRSEGRKFHFYLIKHPEINAFALPGGFIFVTAPLAGIMEEGEIAFVLAHEIGHVVLGHPFDRILADTSARVISRIGKTGVLGKLTMETAERFLRSSYSQEQEMEADRFAAEMMVAAGYRGGHAVSALMKLENHSGDNRFSYFSTHPGHQDRLSALKAKLSRIR